MPDFLQGILAALLPSMLAVSWFVWRASPSKSEPDQRPQISGAPAATKSGFHWREAAVALGLFLSVVWACVLGFGLVKLLELIGPEI